MLPDVKLTESFMEIKGWEEALEIEISELFSRHAYQMRGIKLKWLRTEFATDWRIFSECEGTSDGEWRDTFLHVCKCEYVDVTALFMAMLIQADSRLHYVIFTEALKTVMSREKLDQCWLWRETSKNCSWRVSKTFIVDRNRQARFWTWRSDWWIEIVRMAVSWLRYNNRGVSHWFGCVTFTEIGKS